MNRSDASCHEKTSAMAESPRRWPRRPFAPESLFSATDLADLLRDEGDRARRIARLLADSLRQGYRREADLDALVLPRAIHSLASAISAIAYGDSMPVADAVPGLRETFAQAERSWLERVGLLPDADTTVGDWCERARRVAMEHLGRVIVASGAQEVPAIGGALRSDEIVWGRSAARLDLCGGWTDTPPYSLEFGGCVLNAAVNLNGQPPIQVFARVIEQPVVRIASIDRGARLEISRPEELLDYRDVASQFSLVKAALVLSGLPESSIRGSGEAFRRRLAVLFGGGIELTTFAAIPAGSGLGTSSIMGAVVLAVLDRVLGRDSEPRELFHRVLRLEQALTTGGGWQDQIGGVIEGVKLVRTAPGLVPDPAIHFVPPDVLDPAGNGGQTLLYYTGLTRLARNILQRVVGRCLDRDRAAMQALAALRELAPQAAHAMARRDLPAFGGFLDDAWQLNKQLDPDSSDEVIDALLARVRPNVYGAKLLGAGGGGFLLLVCRSPGDATAVRRKLAGSPPNPRARFFQFGVNREGLRVTAC